MSFSTARYIEEIKKVWKPSGEQTTYLEIAIELGISEETLRKIRTGKPSPKYLKTILLLHSKTVGTPFSQPANHKYIQYIVAREESYTAYTNYVESNLHLMSHAIASPTLSDEDKGLFSFIISLMNFKRNEESQGIQWSLNSLYYFGKCKLSKDQYVEFTSKAVNNIAMAKLNKVHANKRRTDKELHCFLKEYQILESYKSVADYLKIQTKDMVGLRNGLVVSEILGGPDIDSNLSLFHNALISLDPAWKNPKYNPIHLQLKHSVSTDPDLTYYYSKFFKGKKE